MANENKLEILTDDQVMKMYGISAAKKKDDSLEKKLTRHFSGKFGGDITLSNEKCETLSRAAKYIFNKIAKDYEVTIEEILVRKPCTSNDFYTGYRVSISTGDSVDLSTREITYNGNGHLEISHRMSYILKEIKNNPELILKLRRKNIEEIISPILYESNLSLIALLKQRKQVEKSIESQPDYNLMDINELIIRTPKEELKCEASVEYFDLGGEVAAELGDKNHVKGDYWQGESQATIIKVTHSDPRFDEILKSPEYRMQELIDMKDINNLPEIINAIVQEDYSQAMKFNERNVKNPQAYERINQSILNYRLNHSKHVSNNK